MIDASLIQRSSSNSQEGFPLLVHVLLATFETASRTGLDFMLHEHTVLIIMGKPGLWIVGLI